MPTGRSLSAESVPWRERALRVAVVIVGILLWFGTQSLIGARTLPPAPTDAGAAEAGEVLTAGDGLLARTASVNGFLREHPQQANTLLVGSSAVIDGLGVFLILRAILGSTLRPFLGLIILFGLRQICQATCALPQPSGIIWHDPGFPSLFVTYGVANDFFFSGHTALAVFGAVEISRLGGVRWGVLGAAIALFEAATVIVLRAHYTMDVFTGVVTALLVAAVTVRLSAPCDRLLRRLAGARDNDPP